MERIWFVTIDTRKARPFEARARTTVGMDRRQKEKKTFCISSSFPEKMFRNMFPSFPAFVEMSFVKMSFDKTSL